MSLDRFFPHLTPKRKVALAGAIVLWVASGGAFLLAVTQVSPALWPPYAVVVVVAVGALSAAVVIIEMIRGVSSRLAGWSDERHFIWVGLTFAALFVIQYTGIRVALSTHGG